MSRPDGSEPSSVRLSLAHCHTASRTSLPNERRRAGVTLSAVAESLAPAAALAAGPGDRLDRDPDATVSAAPRTCRISSSYAAISEDDGHAAIILAVAEGSG